MVPTWWFYLEGSKNDPFADWLVWSSNSTKIPYVHSLSVGGDENEYEHDNPKGTLERMNNELKALGARGCSIVFASGDSGFLKSLKYGASSPFVTAVGGIWTGDIGGEPM